MRLKTPLLISSLLSATLFASTPAVATNSELPDLGDSASSYVSLQQEHQLGRLWLRQLRRQTQTIEMPLATEFLENLIYRLVPHSEVKQSEFEFVIVDQAELNAFAVPGGIIGINFGILLYARDEDELSAVLAHELAHLSQRHFARQVEQAERQQPIAIATLLASILLIATNNPDAGFAGLITSQAASIQNRLAFSREWEREADRVGMKTLVGAGLDPYAMPSMFQAMLQANRYSKRPPEFLLTHPVTETRVADADGRAASYPRRPRLTSFDFEVLQNIARLRYQLTPSEREKHFQHQLTLTTKNSQSYAANQLTLALLAAEKRQPQRGLDILEQVVAPWSDQVFYISLKARLLQQNQQPQQALELVQQALTLRPQDYQLLRSLASAYNANKQYDDAMQVLQRITRSRSNLPAVWRELGETAAKAERAIWAHRANGEYLFATGFQAKALRQMELALKQAQREKNFQQQAAIEQRVRIMAASPSSF